MLANAACEEGVQKPVSSGPVEEVRIFDDKDWGEIYGRTLQLHVPIPEPRRWRMTERGHELVGVHTASHSMLTVNFWEERELQNRSTCKAAAERDGLLEKRAMTVLEEHIDALPDAYDTRFWVAIDSARPKGRIVGHVFAAGAFLKRCYLFHFESSVPSEANSDILGSRLAAARVRMLGTMKLDPPRIGDDGKVGPEPRPGPGRDSGGSATPPVPMH